MGARRRCTDHKGGGEARGAAPPRSRERNWGSKCYRGTEGMGVKKLQCAPTSGGGGKRKIGARFAPRSLRACSLALRRCLRNVAPRLAMSTYPQMWEYGSDMPPSTLRSLMVKKSSHFSLEYPCQTH